MRRLISGVHKSCTKLVVTSQTAPYIKVGMLTKQYTEGDNMHTHLSFFTTENQKLSTKGFDNEFLTQVMLMSLPCDSTWETLVITLLQSTSDTKPLTSADITSCLMQEYRRISGTNSSDSALLTSSSRQKSKSGKKKKKSGNKCSFCGYLGHNEHECRKKKKEEEEKAKSEGNRGRSQDRANAKANLASHNDSDSETLVKANFASIYAEFPSQNQWENDESVHIFIAADTVAYLAKSSKDETYIDSGCTQHLSPCRKWFIDDSYKLLETPIPIHLGDSSVIKAIGVGSLQYLMETPTGIVPGIIPDALHIPEMAASLLSIAWFTDRKHTLQFSDHNCFIFAPTGRCVATASKASGLYQLVAWPSLNKEYANLARSSRNIDINLLHCHLGHLGHDNIKWLIAKGMVDGVDSVGGQIEFCEACVHGKQHRFPFPPSQKRAQWKLDLVHSDVCGPLPYSIGGKYYFITFIDDHTRNIWLYLMRHKHESYTKFREFKALVELQSEHHIKVLHTNGGGEYVSDACSLMWTFPQAFGQKLHSLPHISPIVHLSLVFPTWPQNKLGWVWNPK